MNESKRKMKNTFGLLFLTLLCSMSLLGHERTITGTVNDTKGEPVIGASVMVKGTVIGTATDIDGRYSLPVPASATTLHVTYIGMREMDVPITGTTIDIIMEEDVSSLDELVVIGYGIQRRRDLTGSVASVRGDNWGASVHTATAKNLVIKGLYTYIDPNGPEAAALEADGYSKVNGVSIYGMIQMLLPCSTEPFWMV